MKLDHGRLDVGSGSDGAGVEIAAAGALILHDALDRPLDLLLTQRAGGRARRCRRRSSESECCLPCTAALEERLGLLAEEICRLHTSGLRSVVYFIRRERSSDMCRRDVGVSEAKEEVVVHREME